MWLSSTDCSAQAGRAENWDLRGPNLCRQLPSAPRSQTPGSVHSLHGQVLVSCFCFCISKSSSQTEAALLPSADVLVLFSFLQGVWPPKQGGHSVPAAPWRLGLHVGIPHRQVSVVGGEGRLSGWSPGLLNSRVCVSRAFVDSRIQPIYGGTNEIMKELIARTIVSQKWQI